MSSAQLKALEDYFRLIDRNATTHMIRAATDLGIFSELESGQKTLNELAEKLSLNTAALGQLMDVLCRTELVEKYADDYALSTVARLIPAKFKHLGDHHWQYLSNYIRSGCSLPNDSELPVTDADFQLNQTSIEWTQTPAAMDAATILEVGETRRDLRILEVGCGAAVFGVAISHRDTSSRLTLVDHPGDLQRAVKTVEGVGLEDRVSYVEADFMSEAWVDDLESDEFDLIIVANVLNQLNHENCEKLLGNISRLCHVGSGLAVIDVFPGQEEGDQHREIFALELSLRTSQGQLHRPNKIQEQLTNLGFEDVKYAPLPSAPHIWGLIYATKQ